MSTSARSAAALILAAAWAIGIAAPALAAPDESAGAAPMPPVITTIDGILNNFIPPNAIVPRSPISTFTEPFIPTNEQVRGFFGFIQQMRGPGQLNP
jgi:hypothetical protein